MAGIVRFCHGGDGLLKRKAQERPEKGSDGTGNCSKQGEIEMGVFKTDEGVDMKDVKR